MKKLIILLSLMFLLVGCVESLALLGPATGAANGNLVQSSLKSAASYSVKKTTGKTPLQHVLSYAEEKNPNKKKEKCISFIEKTNSEACMIVNKQISLAQANIEKKISSVQDSLVKKKSFTQESTKEKKQVLLESTFKAEDDNDNLLIKPKKYAEEFVSQIRAKIKKYDERWLGRIKKSQAKYQN
jgi:hypothetical protein